MKQASGNHDAPSAITESRHLAPPPARLRAVIPTGATLWIDGTTVTRSNPTTTLTPGPHALRARIGRRLITQRLEVAAGESLEVRVDTKHRKLLVERRTVASKTD